MLHAFRAGVAAIALALPLVGAADAGSLSLRTGWAIPIGNIVGNVKMTEFFDGFVPVQLDLDFAVSEGVRLGLYGSYGFASVVCNPAISCSGRDIRVGAQALFALSDASFGPWLGVGAGFEHARYEDTTHPYPGVNYVARSDLNGWEATVQGGAAWDLGQRWKVGPYLLLGAGRYEGGDISDSADKAVHAWLQVGIRGSLGF